MKDDNLLTNGWFLLIRSQSHQSKKTSPEAKSLV